MRMPLLHVLQHIGNIIEVNTCNNSYTILNPPSYLKNIFYGPYGYIILPISIYVTSVHMSSGVLYCAICISERRHRILSDEFYHEIPIREKTCGAYSYDS